MASRKRKATVEPLVFAKKSKPTEVVSLEDEEIQLKLKVQDVITSAWGNPIIIDSKTIDIGLIEKVRLSPNGDVSIKSHTVEK